MATEITVFSWIGRQIENVTSQMVVGNIAGFIDLLSPFIVICVAVYIMWRGYMLIMGEEASPAESLFMHCITVILIAGLALNIDNYTTYVMGAISDIEVSLASVITDSRDNSVTVFQTLDTLLSKSIDQIAYCWENFSVFTSATWSWGLLALVMIACYTVITIIAGVMIIGAKFLLTIFTMLGPIFLTAFIFPWSRKFFDNWVGKILENILVMTMGILIITTCIAIFDTFMSRNPVTDKDVSPTGLSITILVTSAVLGYVLRQIPNISAALVGGIATEALKIPKRNQQNEETEQKDTSHTSENNGIQSGRNKHIPQQNPATAAVMERISEHNRRGRERG